MASMGAIRFNYGYCSTDTHSSSPHRKEPLMPDLVSFSMPLTRASKSLQTEALTLDPPPHQSRLSSVSLWESTQPETMSVDYFYEHPPEVFAEIVTTNCLDKTSSQIHSSMHHGSYAQLSPPDENPGSPETVWKASFSAHWNSNVSWYAYGPPRDYLLPLHTRSCRFTYPVWHI